MRTKWIGCCWSWLWLFSTNTCTILGFPVSNKRSGGRPASQPSKIDIVEVEDGPSNTAKQPLEADALQDTHPPTQCKLILLHCTDVYTLDNFCHFETLVKQVKRMYPDATVKTVLTGDFLSPYLLSSIDRGAGMMRALNHLKLDYLTWGNHEADISHRAVCQHVRNFSGTWINSNMLDHEAMESQVEYDVIELVSPDQSHTRRVGLCAVLSDDPNLYSHFKAPGAFGGATLTDPWEALKTYKRLLEQDEQCDLVIPLEHLYVPDDHKTCHDFDFPVILSGHDHHRVDEVVANSRLLKPGMNCDYTTFLEVSWDTPDAPKPTIKARFLKVDDYPANPVSKEQNEKAYSVLEPMRNTELARVPPTFEPLSSNKSRESVTTMGKYLCSLIKSALNVSRRQRYSNVDAVLLMGGNVRGNMDYELGSYFSLEALEAEVKNDETICVVNMPGWVLADGVQATHAGEPISGWFQYDVGVVEDASVHPPVVTHVNGTPLDRNRIYRVATKISDLTNGQSPPLTKFYTENSYLLPPKGAYVNVQTELMTYFARNLWRKLWDSITAQLLERGIDDSKEHAGERLAMLDPDGDGVVTLDNIQSALRDRLGYNVDERETTLAEFVHSFADTTGSGDVRLDDIEIFYDEMVDLYRNDSWRLSYLKPKVETKQNAPI